MAAVLIGAGLLAPAAAQAAISQPKGKAGSAAVDAVQGCARSFGTSTNQDVAWSPDGRFAYTVGGDEGYGAIAVFRRAPGGALRQLRGVSGCLSSNGRGAPLGVSTGIDMKDRCARSRGLHTGAAIVVTPTGAS